MMHESEISFFARCDLVKEVKIITDQIDVSKGYGFVSFYNDVDVQKIVESQKIFHCNWTLQSGNKIWKEAGKMADQ